MGILKTLRDYLAGPYVDVEQRNMSLATFMDHEMWDQGSRVSQQTATRIATVFACQRVLIDAVSTLPMAPYIREKGQRKPFYPWPAWMNAPHGLADVNYSLVDYVAEVASSLLNDGNSYTLCLPYADESCTQVWVLDPRLVTVKSDENGRVTFELARRYGVPGKATLLDGHNIVHIARHRKPGGITGISPVEESASLLGYAIASAKFGQSWYEKGGVPSGILDFPGELTQDQADEIKNRWNDRHAGPDKISIGILSGGMKYQPLSPTFEEQQWIEGMRFSAEQIGAIYGVPLHKLGIATPGAMSYASVEANEQAFVNDTLAPFVETVAKAHDRLLQYPNTYIDISLKGRLRGDTQARAQFYRELYSVGALSPNDIRSLEDQPPVPGGDIYRVPLNLGDATEKSQKGALDLAQAAQALSTAGYSLDDVSAILGLPMPTEEPPEPAGSPPEPDQPGDTAPAASPMGGMGKNAQ